MKQEEFSPLQMGLGSLKSAEVPEFLEQGFIPATEENGFQQFTRPSDIPDLHNEEQYLNRGQRKTINDQFENYAPKDQIRTEAVMNEASNMKQKALGVYSSSPRDALKDLILKGEHQKSYRLFGHEWTLRALDQNDLLSAMDDVSDNMTTSASRMTAVAFAIVVYAVEAIDGVRLHELFSDISPKQFQDTSTYLMALKKALRAYLIGMPPVVIDSLYEKYQEVSKERDAALEELKNS